LEFIACGVGDAFCSYTPNAIKTVGLWDERFSYLNWSEHDYFLRASSWLGYNCAIDDQSNAPSQYKASSDKGTHGDLYRFNGDKCARIAWKPVENEQKITLRTIRQNLGDQMGVKLFQAKWGILPYDVRSYSMNNVGNKVVPLIYSHINYPYFEKDIPDLQAKGYLYI
jgi:hypothetical protein